MEFIKSALRKTTTKNSANTETERQLLFIVFSIERSPCVHEVNLLSSLTACESRHDSTSLLLLQNAEQGLVLGVYLIKQFTPKTVFMLAIFHRGMCLHLIALLLPSVVYCSNHWPEQETHQFLPSFFLFPLKLKHFCKLLYCNSICWHVLSCPLFLFLSPKQSTLVEFVNCLNLLLWHKDKKLLSDISQPGMWLWKSVREFGGENIWQWTC